MFRSAPFLYAIFILKERVVVARDSLAPANIMKSVGPCTINNADNLFKGFVPLTKEQSASSGAKRALKMARPHMKAVFYATIKNSSSFIEETVRL